MPIPVLPILLAIPPAARIIHHLFGDEQPNRDQEKLMRELLAVAEKRLSGMQEQLLNFEKRRTEAETRLAEIQERLSEKQEQLLNCEKRRTEAETRLAEIQERLSEKQEQLLNCEKGRIEAETRLAEIQKRRKWPWSKRG